MNELYIIMWLFFFFFLMLYAYTVTSWFVQIENEKYEMWRENTGVEKNVYNKPNDIIYGLVVKGDYVHKVFMEQSILYSYAVDM